MFLHTMKVILIKLARGNLFSLCYLAVILFVWSTHYSIHLEVEKLREILKKNSCPSGIIDLLIRTFKNRLYVPKQVCLAAPKNELLIILPFLGTMSSNLKRKLKFSAPKFIITM